MKKWKLIAAVLLLSSSSFAQKIKVKRTKGNQAVVEFTGTLSPGQVYEVTQDEYSENQFISSGRRQFLVGLDFAFNSTKSDAPSAANQTSVTLIAKGGWNLGQFEFGPLVTYSSASSATSTLTYLYGGAFGDFNLISNISGEPFLYGLGAKMALGQRDGGGMASANLMELFVGPFLKWFPNGGDVGLRVDAGYVYSKASGGGDTTTTGLGIYAGIISYF